VTDKSALITDTTRQDAAYLAKFLLEKGYEFTVLIVDLISGALIPRNLRQSEPYPS
jgi:GDP-D-mannose dehydratase